MALSRKCQGKRDLGQPLKSWNWGKNSSKGLYLVRRRKKKKLTIIVGWLGKFLSRRHTNYNLNRKLLNKILVFNLSQYDAHLFLKELFNSSKLKITLLACNEERYIHLNKDLFKLEKAHPYLSVVDTLQLVVTSLEKLENNMSS